MTQKMALACFKKGTDEIAGLNINFIESRDEHIMNDVRRQVSTSLLLAKHKYYYYYSFTRAYPN